MKRRHDSNSSSPERKCNTAISTVDQSKTTKITDLVDDCLFEIYKHLNLVELATVADVCQRLRVTSTTSYAQSRCKVLEYPTSILTENQVHHDPLDQLLLPTSKVLRNFGAFVTTFDESDPDILRLLHERLTRKELRKLSRTIMNLLQRYCGESLNVLRLSYVEFTKEMAKIRRPIFPRVHTFEWRGNLDRKFDSDILLSTWFPEMREILIGHFALMREANMQEHFGNLTKATLRDGWLNEIVGRFLMQNPQLKELNIVGDENVTDLHVFEYIGQYTKDIEVMRFVNAPPRFTFFGPSIQDHPYYSTFHYFNALKKLKCFSMCEYFISFGAVLMMRSIVSAAVPLKALTIEITALDPHEYSVLEYILQLKSLEALDLRVKLKSKMDIIRICKQLDKLRELSVSYPGTLYTTDVLEIVQVAPKLQWLYLPNGINFDVNIHERLKNVVKRRSIDFEFVLRVCKIQYLRSHTNRSGWSSYVDVEHVIGHPSIRGRRVMELAVCNHTNVGPDKCCRQHAALTEFPIRFKNKDLRERIDKIYRGRLNQTPMTLGKHYT